MLPSPPLFVHSVPFQPAKDNRSNLAVIGPSIPLKSKGTLQTINIFQIYKKFQAMYQFDMIRVMFSAFVGMCFTVFSENGRTLIKNLAGILRLH